MVQAKKAGTSKGVRFHAPQKPNFVKLQKGEAFEGVFLGVVQTIYGKAYAFVDERGEKFTLGGQRAVLDQCFLELLGNPSAYPDQTIIGHKLIVERSEDDIESKSGRMVAQYQIGHVFSTCPKKCKQ